MAGLNASRAGRFLLLPLMLMLAVGAIVNSCASQLRLTLPGTTLRLRPGDAIALSRSVDDLITSDRLTRDQLPVIDLMAHRALRSDPLTAPALRQLSLVAAAAGDAKGSAALLDIAHRVTRREMGTLLLLVTNSAVADDADKALNYIDEALTANRSAADLFFPALEASIANPSLRLPISRYLRRDRPWMPALLSFLLRDRQRDGVDAAALILAAGGLPDSAAYAGIHGRVLAALADHNRFDVARIYLTRTPRLRSGMSMYRGADTRTDDPELGPFGWRYTESADYGARLAEDGRITGRIGPGQVGTVARRTLLLNSGRYTVADSGRDRDIAVWELRCLASVQQPLLWRREGPAGARSDTFEISPQCPAQALILVARGDDLEDARFEVAPPILRRLGRGDARKASR